MSEHKKIQTYKDINGIIWTILELFRDKLEPLEQMQMTLTMLGLRVLNEKYNKAIKQLLADGMIEKENEETDIDLQVFKAIKIPPNAKWSKIMDNVAKGIQIGESLDNALESIENTKDEYNDIFFKNFNRKGLDNTMILDVLKEFDKLDLSNSKEDIAGRVYEKLLGHFFSEKGSKAGQYFTTPSIVNLMVSMLDVKEGKIYDPAAGSGGMLTQAKHYAIDKYGPEVAERIVLSGQEYVDSTWKLAKLNLILNGESLINHNLDGTKEYKMGSINGSTFTNDQHRGETYDYIMANPPFNQKKKTWWNDSLIDDPRFFIHQLVGGDANYAWIQIMLDKLNSKTGKAAIVLANGSLTSSAKSDVIVRKWLIDNNKLSAVVNLPANLFFGTGIPACIYFYDMNK